MNPGDLSGLSQDGLSPPRPEPKDWRAEDDALIANLEHYSAAKDARIAELQAEVEVLNMQLVACMTACFQNTETTIKDRIGRENPYWSVAYSDVCTAINREMALRAEVARLTAENAELVRDLKPIQLVEEQAQILDERLTWVNAENDELRAEVSRLKAEIVNWRDSNQCFRDDARALRLDNISLIAENATLARWIVAHHDPEYRDLGCAECCPGAETVIEGFRCGVHLAKEISP